MRTLLYVLSALAVIGLAFWAYRENYTTQQAIEETEDLQDAIGSARAKLNVLKAEWAYLNRPDRLRELAEINFDRLGLQALRPDQFGRVAEVRFRSAETSRALAVTGAIDVFSGNAKSGGQKP